MSSNGELINLPEYSYPEFRKSESSSLHSSPFDQPCNPIKVIPDDLCTLNPHVASCNNDETCSIASSGGENCHRGTSTSLIDSQEIETSNIDSQWISNSFIDQVSHPTESLKSKLPVRKADVMTVDQTAAWIWMVGHVSGWEEADQYAQSFQQNNIWGILLQELTLDNLKSDLGITNYWHRTKIMSAINRLDLDTGWDNELGADNEHGRTPRDTQIFVNVPSIHEKKEGTNYSEKSVPTFKNNHIDINPYNGENQAFQFRSKSTTYKWLPSNTKAKSRRARPDNPIRYKTYHNVKIRSGKSVRSHDVCYLPRGSVVVINQIKGRSGRVVCQQGNGEFVKLGWVTLYTKDRQLLRKYDGKKIHA